MRQLTYFYDRNTYRKLTFCNLQSKLNLRIGVIFQIRMNFGESWEITIIVTAVAAATGVEWRHGGGFVYLPATLNNPSHFLNSCIIHTSIDFPWSLPHWSLASGGPSQLMEQPNQRQQGHWWNSLIHDRVGDGTAWPMRGYVTVRADRPTTGYLRTVEPKDKWNKHMVGRPMEQTNNR